jgi:hypothetical protein
MCQIVKKKKIKLNKHSTIPLSPNIVRNNEHSHCTIEPHSTSLRFYSLNPSALIYVTLIFLSTPHFASLHFYILHFASLVITFLTLFLKQYVLPVRALLSPSVSWLQSDLLHTSPASLLKTFHTCTIFLKCRSFSATQRFTPNVTLH